MSIMQNLIDGDIDIQAFSEFLNSDAATEIPRRLNLPVHSLSYYEQYLEALKSVYTQTTGTVTVDGIAVKPVTVAVRDAIDAAILGDYKTQLEQQIASVAGGRKSYKTYALMTADKANIPANSIVDITNDTTTANNGAYNYDGTTFTKSSYDPVTLAKADATAKAEAATQVSKSYTDNEHVKTIEYYPDSTALLATTPKLSGQIAYAKSDNAYYEYQLYNKPQQAETTALISRFTTKPSATAEGVINRLIYDLKQAGVWSKLDGLWIARTTSFADSKLNWIKNDYNLVSAESNPAEFIPETSAFNFAQNRFDTLLNPAISTGLKSSQNNITVGSLLFKPTSFGGFVGAYDGVSGISLNYTTSAISARLNQSTASTVNTKSTGSQYATVTSVREGDAVKLYQDSELLKTDTVVSVPALDSTLKIGKLSDTLVSTSQGVYAVYIASALTSLEIAAIDKALKLYRDRFAKSGLGVGLWEKKSEGTTIAPDSSVVSSYIFNGETTVATPTAKLTGVVNESVINQEYMGGYIEIQPDSYVGGQVPPTNSTSLTWGFPQSLSNAEQARLRNDLFKGDGKGLQYIRFPLGYAYRGYRNIDPVSKLARNIGERYLGQNAALRKLFANIAKAGGGLAPEYWCPPVHWLTGGAYNGGNQITAGGTYPRSTTLQSIRLTDPTQYAAQIDAFTNAVVDDYEYIHQNIAPVRMYGLSNEPAYSGMEYGACSFDAETYSDIVLALHPKVQSSAILSEWEGEPNTVLLHVASDDHAPYWSRVAKLEAEHPEYIWGYTHHMIREINGQNSAGNDFAADYYRSASYATALAGRKNVFLNEYEYFTPAQFAHEWKCSNNMLAYINSVIYSDARVIMPIIHVCKQLGATSLSTNTEGYALVQCNLQKGYGLAPNDPANADNADYGTYRPVYHNYNAWRFIADNLPIGAIRIGGTPTNRLNRVNYVVYKFANKLIVLIVNSTSAPVDVTLEFAKSRTFNGSVYNISKCAATLKPKDGQTLTFTIPAYSGQAWVEV